jgi:hypothetical protein
MRSICWMGSFELQITSVIKRGGFDTSRALRRRLVPLLC